MTTRFDGTIKTWNDERGFGFIETTLGNQEVFVHIRAFTRRGERPHVGMLVSFEIEPGPQGKKRACKVEQFYRRHTPRRSAEKPAQWGTTHLALIPAFLVLYVLMHYFWHIPAAFGLVYLGFSLLTYGVYAHDKSAARRGGRRVPESTLHVLSLLGGWPGALLAQRVLHHKSVKAEFRWVFWLTLAANIALFLMLGIGAAQV